MTTIDDTYEMQVKELDRPCIIEIHKDDILMMDCYISKTSSLHTDDGAVLDYVMADVIKRKSTIEVNGEAIVEQETVIVTEKPIDCIICIWNCMRCCLCDCICMHNEYFMIGCFLICGIVLPLIVCTILIKQPIPVQHTKFPSMGPTGIPSY